MNWTLIKVLVWAQTIGQMALDAAVWSTILVIVYFIFVGVTP